METILSLAILAMTLFALISTCVVGLRSDKKGHTETVAAMVADRELTKMASDALNAANTTAFWTTDYPYGGSPYVADNITVGSDTFSYTIYLATVNGTSGTPLGATATSNLIKKIDIVVWWWSANGQREGSGKTQTAMTRLVGQGDAP